MSTDSKQVRATIADRPLTMITDPETTDFLGNDGQIHKLVTKEQAPRIAARFMKKFNPEEYIAMKINRQHIGGKDYFFAWCVKKYNDEDISSRPKDTVWIGRIDIMLPQMHQDTEEYSPSLGSRIPVTEEVQYPDGKIRPIPVIGKTGYHYYHEVNAKNIELYKKLYGTFPEGRDTELIWQLNNGSKPSNCTDPNEFWTVAIKTIEDALKAKQRKSVLDGTEKDED